jgi:folylpolyglutamate synthase/dihydropteroate synthase
VAGAFIASENASPRCAPAADLARIIARVSGREPIMEPSLGNAISRARALGGGTIVTGSLYTAGLARALFA